MFWNAVALFAGAFCGAAFNMALVMLNGVFWPVPPELDPSDMASMGAYVDSLPLIALLVVLVAHVGQAFVGAGVAAVLAQHKMVMAWVVGLLALAGGVANMLMIPHPTWMWVEVPLYLVATWAGGTLAVRHGPSFDEGPPQSA